MSTQGLVKQADGTYRLTNMDIGETSMVDRAANKRKWLFAKSEDEMGTAALTEDGNGNFTITEEGGAAATTKTEGTPETDGNTTQAPGSSVVKLELSTTKKGELAPLADKLLDGALTMRNAIATAKEGQGEAVPPEIVAGLKALSAALGDLEKACGAPGTHKPKEGDAEAAAEAATGKDAKTEKEGPLRIPPRATGDEDEENKPEENKSKVGKADAPTHQKLLDELVSKIVEAAEDVAKNAKGMDYKDLRAKVSKMEEMTWKMRGLSNVVAKAVDEITDEDLAELAKGVVPERLQKIGQKMSRKNRIQFQGAITQIKAEIDKLFDLYSKLLPPEEKEALDETKKAHGLLKRVHDTFGLPPYNPTNAGAGTWPDSPAQPLPAVAGPEAKSTMTDVAKAEQERISKREAGAVEPPSAREPEPEPEHVSKGAGDDDDDGWPMDMNASSYLEEVRKAGRY